MSSCYRRVSVIALLAFLLLPILASAVPITFDLVGQVDSVSDPAGILAGAGVPVAVGDTFTGSYTFESTTPDGNPAASLAQYFVMGAPYGFSVNMGGATYSYTTGGSPSVHITVGNNNPTMDTYGVSRISPIDVVSTATFPSIAWMDMMFTLMDTTGAVFSDTNLLLTPPTLSDFNINSFLLIGNTGTTDPPGFSISGRLTDLTLHGAGDPVIPEPCTLVLLGLGSMGLASRRRRRG
ncbi:PEP-CTERM sorting domain-containing protein [bacterium]|nr:PEP-CTERM sorting domain-containing protein [bacterium]